MEPKYQKDDIVIFEQLNENSLFNGKDCIVAVDGNDATLKKVSINEQGIILQSYNPSFNILSFSNEQMQKLPVKIIGIAREKRTKL